MQPLRRTALAAARTSRFTLSRQPRRFAHDEPPKTAGSPSELPHSAKPTEHGSEHHHEHAHEHAAPVNESFGVSFWLAIGFVPAAWALWTVTRPGENPNEKSYLTNLIDEYTERQEKWAAIADLHTRALEQAGTDRRLFNSAKPFEYVDMKMPEMIGVHSPYNVPAGIQVNLDHVIEKYRREAYEKTELQLEQQRTGTLPVDKPFDREEYVRSRIRRPTDV
ncbi:hypothetical protein P154DRAFT_493901 [Amniculicola lignicola CBS 123094]|uniref:NADH-ubiquinone oxidoreductase 17.8 kDa subunit n=1 Tax=Amniculicola lignicola CBS 123094 TaxID=1392246 RepID=A0A6A5WC20_9PLEO|nr:hypothetical protein P154DRAFT_493901 [Amniculicola lignicola CBS 123094]